MTPLGRTDLPVEDSVQALQPTFSAVTSARHDVDRRRFAIDVSRDVVPQTTELFDTKQDGLSLDALHESASIGERELHRMRKISEVYENELRIRFPSGSLYRAALTAGKMTTVGGILISLDGLHEATAEIESAYADGGAANVDDDLIEDFYIASGVFIGELVLMMTPVSANFAFQATGRLHSRLLWHRFKDYRSAYRILLHHIYYFLNGIPSLAVHKAGDAADRLSDFVRSIVFLIERTWEWFNEPTALGNLSSSNLASSFFQSILDLSLDDFRDEFGNSIDELERHIETILADLQTHYTDLLSVLGVDSAQEIITEVIRVLIDRR